MTGGRADLPQQAPGLPSGESQYSSALANTLAAALMLAVAAFYLATLRDGHDWGDDFALYIHHAKNIVEGRPYTDIGLIQDPARPQIDRAPPGFPLLLAPVYWAFGLDLTAMKVEVILFFAASLAMVWLLFHKELPSPYPLALVALVGFQPLMWQYKDMVLSDFPFLFLLYLGMLVYRQAQTAERDWKRQTGWAAGAGVCVYAATATRMLGVVFVASIIASDLLRVRRVSRAAWIMAGVFLVLFELQRLWLPADQGYVQQSQFDLRVILGNLQVYWNELRGLWKGHKGFVQLLLRAGALGLALIGLLWRCRRGVSALEVFFVLYIASLLVWSFHDKRYLIPVVPLCMLYWCSGLVQVQRRLGRSGRAVALILVVVLLGGYAVWYTKMLRRPLEQGIGTPACQEVFRYVRDHTDQRDVLVFIKPRALALFTGRQASPCPEADDDSVLRHFGEIRASYALVGPEHSSRVLREEGEPLRRLVEGHPERFALVYMNEDFQLYHFAPARDTRLRSSSWREAERAR